MLIKTLLRVVNCNHLCFRESIKGMLTEIIIRCYIHAPFSLLSFQLVQIDTASDDLKISVALVVLIFLRLSDGRFHTMFLNPLLPGFCP